MFIRRTATVAAATVAAFALSIGTANAHFCFNKNAAQQGAQGMANSQGFVSFYDLAKEFTGLCDDGIDILAAAGGVETWTPINVRTTMAQGSGGKSKGIDYLDFDAMAAADDAAQDACS